MTEQRRPDDSTDDPEAEAALDHALRERPIDQDDVYDDELIEDAAADPAAPADDGTGSSEIIADDGESEEAEDYVLYSEVRPHLEELVVLQDQRGKMIDILLYARDRVSSPAVASRMDDNLSQLGIQILVPQVGELFDPAQHEASATVATNDPAAHGTIAEVELAGYSDGDRVVRPPVVTVYSADKDAS